MLQTVLMTDAVILIAGGYGAVGREVAARLAPAFPGEVRVAGRNRAAADACAARIGHGAQGVELDVDAQSALRVRRGDVVVMCADPSEPTLARDALAAGAHYVDITADLDRLRALEALDSLARRNDATGVLSVGLAPGLTNLLAAQAARRVDRLRRLDLIVLLGAGDAHGSAAVQWTLDNLGAHFAATRGGLPHPVRAFAGRLAFQPGPTGGTLPAFRFPFPEQRTAGRTLAVPDVNGWLALEPAAAGYLAALLARTGAGRVLRRPGVRRLAVRTLSAGVLGPARAGAVVLAHHAGPTPGVLQLSATGNGQNAVTALVAAAVVRALLHGPPVPGVRHIEQLPDGDDLTAQLHAAGLSFRERRLPGPPPVG